MKSVNSLISSKCGAISKETPYAQIWKPLMLTLIALMSISSLAIGNSFYLSVNQVFTSEQDALIYHYNYNYNYTTDDKIRLKLYKLDLSKDMLRGILMQNNQMLVNDSLIQDLTPVKTWEEKMPNRYGYNNNINLGKLDQGLYVLEGINAGMVSKVPVFISDLSIVTQSSGTDIVAFVTNAKTGEIKDNFNLAAYHNNRRLRPISKKDGAVMFRMQDVSNNIYSYNIPVIAYSENQVAVSQSYLYTYYYNQQASMKYYAFPDRSAYRPEQWVRFKGIVRIPDGFNLKVSTDSVVCKITGPTNLEVYSKTVALDKFGSFDDSLYIGKDFVLGDYTIKVTPADVTGHAHRYYYGQQSNQTFKFKVEEYKKPEYEVVVNLDKTQYTSGDNIKVKVQADYFFGAPVTNADVSYKIVREAYHTPWYYWSPYYWWYSEYYNNSYAYGQEVIHTGTGKIGKNGNFEFDVQTEEKQGQNYKYSVLVNVTDASRREIAGSSSAIVAHTEYVLTAHSERYYVEPDEPIEVLVKASDYGKQPVVAKVEAQLYDYRYSWLSGYQKKGKLDQTSGTTNPVTGEVSLELFADEPGYYIVEVKSYDSRGKEINTSCYSYVMRPGDNYYSWWNNGSGDIMMITDKKVYESGEPIRAMVYSKTASDLMVTLGGQSIAHFDVFKAKGDHGTWRTIEIPTDNSLYGKMEMMAVYVSEGRIYQKKDFITIVPKQKYLDVEIVFDESQYKPGQDATAIVKVTDHNGKPVPFANITLATADESIYSLYPDQIPNIEKSFYSSAMHYYNYVYMNRFSSYNYGTQMDVDGLLWRMKKYDIDFDRSAFVPANQQYTMTYKTVKNDKGVIRGFVIDGSTGKPIKGAAIEIGSRTFHSDELGYYHLKEIDLSHITLSYRHGRNEVEVKNIEMYKDKEVHVNVVIGNSDQEIVVRRDEDVTITDIDREDDGISIEEALDEVVVADYAVPVMAEKSVATLSSVEVTSARAFTGNAAGFSMDMMDMNQQFEVKDKFVEPVVRSDFRDVVLWKTNLVTDPFGRAKVTFKLPDNLTTWRTVAKVVTLDTKIGQTNAKIIVKKNLLVRMETPRFFTLGDRVKIATTVHNYFPTPKRVRLQLLADGVKVPGKEQMITLNAGGEKSIDWDLEAHTITKGAQLTVKAISTEESDAQLVKVPVLPYGLEVTDAISLYTFNNDQDENTFIIPGKQDPRAVTLEISTAPSVSSALLSSMKDLVGYPYGCVEQTMSRFLPTVVVAETLEKLGKSYDSGISKDELQKMIAQGFKRLGELQHNDGGWGWWQKDQSHPFMTSYVFNGLHIAKAAGYDVDENVYSKAQAALKGQMSNASSLDGTTRAYMMSIAISSGLTEFWKDRYIKPSAEPNAYEVALWLQAAAMMDDEDKIEDFVQQLESMAITEGSFIYWGGKRFYYNWQDDHVETTAHAVRALSMAKPNHKMIPGGVQWLMSKRHGNSWYNTRQTAMTIYGMSEVIKRELNPDLDLEIWVNGSMVHTAHLTSQDVYSKTDVITLYMENIFASSEPMIGDDAYVLTEGENTIEVRQKGSGSTYVNCKLSYFLNGDNHRLSRTAQTFNVQRTYYKLIEKKNANGNITYMKKELNEKDVKSGDKIFVKVTVKNNNPQSFVLIEDPIPSGCEFVRNTKGYVIEGEPNYIGNDYYNGYGYYYWNWNRWYTHREYRDSKLAMTITNLGTGEYSYSYIMNAQIPGEYNINPTVAQLMYYPENRGYSEFRGLTITD